VISIADDTGRLATVTFDLDLLSLKGEYHGCNICAH
jgi:hypothetical protein